MRQVSHIANRVSSIVRGCFVLFLALLCAAPVYGQSKKKVAVYVTGDADAGTKKVIGAKLVAAITKDDGYAAVERTADFLAELSKEQAYQRSGAVNVNQIAKLGEQFGVAFVCVADITTVYGSLFVSARLINVLTGLVTATAERDKEISGMADLTELSDDVADGLINNVAECNKKDQPMGRKGCCAGLQAVDGVCRDMSGDMYWLPVGTCPRMYLAQMMPRVDFLSTASCPAGYRVADSGELECLNSTPYGKSLLSTYTWWSESDYRVAWNTKKGDWAKRSYWSPDGPDWHYRFTDNKYNNSPPPVHGYVCVRE